VKKKRRKGIRQGLCVGGPEGAKMQRRLWKALHNAEASELALIQLFPMEAKKRNEAIKVKQKKTNTKNRAKQLNSSPWPRLLSISSQVGLLDPNALQPLGLVPHSVVIDLPPPQCHPPSLARRLWQGSWHPEDRGWLFISRKPRMFMRGRPPSLTSKHIHIHTGARAAD